MAKNDFYVEKDVPNFQENVCRKNCVMQGKCIEESKDVHWFLMCPHYHSWKLGYTSFVFSNCDGKENAGMRIKNIKNLLIEQRRKKIMCQSLELEMLKKLIFVSNISPVCMPD